MSKTLLKRIFLASTMALCTHPLLGMENTNPFSDFGEINMNRPQVYAQQQQPQFPMIAAPQHNGFQWMNQVPQNQVIQLSPQYVMTPMGAHIIYQTTYQTVYLLPQPLQHNPMPIPQNQQPLMPFAAYPGNHVVAQGGMNVMPQQQMFFNPLQPGLSQELGGMKRRSEINTAQNNQSRGNPFGENFPCELTEMILKIVSISNLKEIDNVGELEPMGNPLKLIKLVCNSWKNIVKGDKSFIFANEVIRSAYRLTDDEFEIYQRFVKGKLIYRPNQTSDEGMIELKISDLWNPLGGRFNLSQCGNTAQYLSISTGYRKEKKAENSNKVEVWFTPRFLVKKELNSTAGHFKGILPSKWNDDASVGMFWTWGNWENLEWYDYLTSESTHNLSKINLYENWRRARRWLDGGLVLVSGVWRAPHVGFMFRL